jgi:microsomal dipeptidase-like Zn-dependent dipeptidase
VLTLAFTALYSFGPKPLEPAEAQSTNPLWGYADLHNHQFSNLGFGGMVVWGAPFTQNGSIASALPWSDWTPSNKALCDANDPGKGMCSSEVVDASNNPVGLFTCPNVPAGVPNCAPTSPALQGTCPATPCDGVLVQGPGGLGDLVNNVLSGSAGHLVGGYPQFNGWPRWNNYTGQQVYYEWLKRAFDGGLRLIVMDAVNNEVLCQLSSHIAAYGCDDMSAVDRQIQAAKDLEAFIDQQSGGPGKGWYRIAYSGAQARQIIASGKLAVVLGIEVPGLFGCKKNSSCTAASVKSDLNAYYAKGVRHMFPVHVVDNAFGGTAIYSDIFEFVNKLIAGDWWDVGSCAPNSGIDFHLELLDNIQALAQRAQNPGPTDFVAWVAHAAGLTTQNAPPAPPANDNCNNRGLQPLGETLVDEMMNKGMIIDVDHSSALTLAAILQRATARRYPGIAMGHTGFIDTGKYKDPNNPQPYFEYKRHEGNKTADQITSTRALGGMPGVILHQGSYSSIKQFQRANGSFVPFACGFSSEAWAQVYLYAASKMTHAQTDLWPSDPAAAAIGSDFNGLAGMPAPRFGSEKCAGDFPGAYVGPARVQVAYPFTELGTGTQMDKMQVGNKVFDVNDDGLANVGMLPDFVAELQADGVTTSELDPLFHSAEAYVRMWERAEDQTPPTITCGQPDGQWHANDVTVSCSASDAVAGLDKAADASFTLSTSVPAGTETANASTGTRTVCDRRLNCATIGPITGFKIDKKAPVISIVAPADGGSYQVNQPLTAQFSCTDGGSGVASCAGTVPNGATVSTSAPGSYSFTVNATDAVANASAKTVSYTVTYRVCLLYDAAKPLGTPNSTVPIKLQICDVNGTDLSSPAIIVLALNVDGSTPAKSSGNANPGNIFRYDVRLPGYIYSLDTRGLSRGTHVLNFSISGDPIKHGAGFVLS